MTYKLIKFFRIIIICIVIGCNVVVIFGLSAIFFFADHPEAIDPNSFKSMALIWCNRLILPCTFGALALIFLFRKILDG